jgi:hypoxanthine phosphoribosyltransferase
VEEASDTVLYTASDIGGRVRDIGGAITRDYEGRAPVLITILKGGTMFLADLFRAVRLPASVDFMSISSYGEESTGSGVVRIEKDLDQDIGGQDVIIVEDIVDTGLTLTYLLSTLREREPASLEVCTLLDKVARRITPLDIRYRGFECPDRFVVGYGLDLSERYRNLPFILTVEDPGAADEEHGNLIELLGAAGEAYR